jgi:hypothetical protein
MRHQPCTGQRISRAVEHRSVELTSSIAIAKGSVQASASADSSDTKSIEYCKSLTMKESRENSRRCDVQWGYGLGTC